MLRDLAARAEEPERPGGEQHPIDDVAEADVAEVRPLLLVAAVDQHPHAPVAGHLAELEHAEGEAELDEQVAEVESAGVHTVAVGAPLPAEVLEGGREIAGDQAAKHVERALHLDLVLLDDLRRQPQAVLHPPLLAEPRPGPVEQVVGLAVQAQPVGAVDADVGRRGRERREEEEQRHRVFQGPSD